jgi:hypothetical protein
MASKEVVTMICDNPIHEEETAAETSRYLVTESGAYRFDGCGECIWAIDAIIGTIENGERLADVRADRVAQMAPQTAGKRFMGKRGSKRVAL